MCDASITNPPESTEALSSKKGKIKLSDSLSPSVKRTAQILAYINLGNLLYFIVFNAASDILPVSYVSSKLEVIVPISVILIPLSSVFLFVLLKDRTISHSYEFVQRLFDCQESMIINSLKSPAKTLEVAIQSLSSAMNQAVTNGNIVAQIFIFVFSMPDGQIFRGFVYSGVFSGGYGAIFSRVLNVYEQYFNKKFEKINLKERNFPVSKLGLFIDIIMSILRGLPTGVLVYKYINLDAKMAIGCITGSFFGVHNLYVRYYNRLHMTALHHQKDDGKAAHSSFSGLSASSKNLALANNVFEELALLSKTPRLQKITTAFNFSARLCGSLSFLGFLFFLNEALDLKADFYSILCVHQLWGNTTLENDFSFYQNALVDIWSSAHTKFKMEKIKPQYGTLNSIFCKSKKDYSLEYLNSVSTSLGR